MPPLGTLSEAELQILNDPTRSVKRAELASLCRKASLKVKGTNAQLIAALNAAVRNDVVNQENVDPLASQECNRASLDDDRESSFQTVIYQQKPEWTQSTPAPSSTRKSSGRRKTSKRKSNTASTLYPQLSVYPSLEDTTSALPTTSAEEFSKVADGILEEMNAPKQNIAPPSPSKNGAEPIFKDTQIPEVESPFIVDTKKGRFSEAHSKIFERMDSVETHYAALRDKDSPRPSPGIRVPKRPSRDDTSEPSPKRLRSADYKGSVTQAPADENLSPQGKDIQDLVRQDFQKRLQMKLGVSSDGEDSIELESRHVAGKVGLESGSKLAMGKRLPKSPARGKVIPVKLGGTISGLGTGSSDELSLERSRNISVAIKPPTLSANQPSIKLVPEKPVSLPKDKKIPTKHTQQKSTTGSRALVIPAAKPSKPVPCPTRAPKQPTYARSLTTAQPPVSPWKVNFTMGSIPTNPQPSPRRKSLRSASRRQPNSSPSRMRVTRGISAICAATQKPTIRAVTREPTDLIVPVRFEGGKGKRKYAEADEPSPAKRVRLNEGTTYTPVRNVAGLFSTPSNARIRHEIGNSFSTPATSAVKVYGRAPGTASRGAGEQRPPWR